MRTVLFVGALIALCSVSAFAQQKEYLLSADKRLSIAYKVGPKETLFSLGRKFYVHPRYLATFNKLSYDKGLNLGQSLLIPLTDTNFSKTDNNGVPVYKKLAGSQKKLRAGYLIKNELAAAAVPDTAAITTPIAGVVEAAPSKIAKDAPVPAPARVPSVSDTIVNTEKAGYFRYAYEEQLLAQGSSTLMVKAGIFKTTSGWRDFKYYLLTNAAEAGTYVALYAASTQKTVYAKVLGTMSGIRQNEGYDIRISNAAAEALGVGEATVFELEMRYLPSAKR